MHTNIFDSLQQFFKLYNHWNIWNTAVQIPFLEYV